MMLKRRFLLAGGVILWMVMILFTTSSHEPTTNEVQSLYRQITRALTKSEFYGHDVLSKNSWYFKTRKEKLTSLDFPFIIDGANICGNDVKPILLIVVLSLHNNTKERQAIRQTYGRPAKGHSWPGKALYGEVRMVFMFGDSKNPSELQIIEEEAKIHQDIVMANFTESYFNLTYKVLMSLKWMETYCHKAQYVMKVDEDTFVDIPRIIEVLVSINLTNEIYGHFHYADEVERKGKSKVTRKAYPMSTYPPHVKGNIYVMPAGLGITIMHLAQYLPYVNMEDAHVTGNVAKLLDARHHDIPVEQYDPLKPPKMCDFALHRKIAAQKVDPPLAYKLWNAISDPSLCAS